ncbi:MAG: CbiX/SirB N-terminal domain-containing protein [Candidatus Solibacter sp.]
MNTAIIVFAHGSRIEAANQAVRAVAGDFARATAHPMVEAAFLELGRPSLEEAADLLVQRGAQTVLILPYFLTPGLHLERDLPVLVQNISNKHKDIQVIVTPSLDGHPGLVEILADRARAALVEHPTLK